MTTTITRKPLVGILSSASADHPVWVRVGWLLDGSGAAPLTDAHLVYDASGIRYVGPSDRPPPAEVVSAGQSSPDVDLRDCTVLPGLIEAHAHLFLDGASVDFAERSKYLELPPDDMLQRGRKRLSRIVRTGVMAVRDAGDNRGVGLALQRERQGGTCEPLAALIDSPGAAIHHRGRYGGFMSGAIEDFDSPEACVEARCAAGAARIKLIATGIINFKQGAVTTPPQMSADEIRRFVAAATRCNRLTFAHASGADGVENCVEGGVGTVEHGFFITDDQLALMRDRGIGWVPTFAPVQLQVDRAQDLGWSDEVVSNLQRILDAHAESLRRAHAMGVRVIAGSDAGSCGVPHGLGLLTEMELMERAGMPTAAVLASATGRSAEMLQFAEPIGRVAPECKARLIFTRHSPLDGVANLRKEKTVIFDGQAIEVPADLTDEGL